MNDDEGRHIQYDGSETIEGQLDGSISGLKI